MSENGYVHRPLRTAIDDHVGGGTPPRQVPSYWKGDIPWASVKDFPEQAAVIIDTQEHISAAGLNASASNLIPAGTPLVCTRMAVGRAAMPSVAMAINQDVKALFPAAGVSPAYLLKLLRFIQPKAEAQAVGSTVKGIRVQDYLDIAVPIADTNAQPVIAIVLDTLDTAIHETEAMIAKLKAVNQGLLHDLLTRGLDANGELRPPQTEAAHLYKQSALGWIPKEWSVEPFGSKIEVIDPNPSHRYPREQDHGVPICSTENFDGEDDFVLSHSKRMPDSVFVAQDLRCEFSEDQVIFARKGRIGLARRYGKEKKVFSHTVVVLTRQSEAVDQKWILWLARSAMFLDGIRVRMNSNSGVPTLGIELIKSVLTAFPDYQEQALIGQILDNGSASIRTEERQMAGLVNLKRGLMDDLLTGRVRITPLLKQAEQ